MIENPIVASDQTFQVEIYEDTSKVYIIDKASSGLIPGLECVMPCRTCISNSEPDQCTSCHTTETDGYEFLPYLQGNTCVSECPDGMYADKYGTCQACFFKCATCSDVDVCTTCIDDDYTKLYNGNCLSECPDGTYEDEYEEC